MKQLVVEAGEHDRSNCPVWVPGDLAATGPTAPGFRTQHGAHVPAQAEQGESGRVCLLLDALGKGDAVTLSPAAEDANAGPGVVLTEQPDDTIDVTIGGESFTRYHHGSNWGRPFLLPIAGPFGDPVTRGYPVAPVPGEMEDHPHHKSCWVAWGDVNGTDNWSEVEGHARQVHRSFRHVESGPVFGRIVALNDWVSNTGEKVLEETRTMIFYNLPRSGRTIDLTVSFVATEGPVTFGDTKEGGIASIRVATSMDGTGDGVIRNSYGGVGEKETWGKRAHWCDYVGPVNGKTVGISIFDTPGNFRYPTYWHVRDYGLMTANPFGVSYFVDDKARNGAHSIAQGETLTFRYRLFFHAGTTAEAGVADRFLDYVAPPSVRVAE